MDGAAHPSSALRVLIVDDEPLAIERMRQLLAAVPEIAVVGAAQHGEEALERVAALKPDLVFLDIQMPGLSGMAVAQAIGAAGGPAIVFVSAFDHYAARAFEVDAADYLLKPVSPERLARALQRARRSLTTHADAAEDHPGEDHIWAPGRNGAVRLPLSEVTWVQAEGDYVLIHTALKQHLLRGTMTAMARRMARAGLVRVHRSALVRPTAVIEASRTRKGSLSLQMTDGAVVPVGPSYRPAVLELLRLRRAARSPGAPRRPREASASLV